MRLQNLLVAIAVSIVVPVGVACSDNDPDTSGTPDGGEDAELGDGDAELDAYAEVETGFEAAPDLPPDIAEEEAATVDPDVCLGCIENMCAEEYQVCIDHATCGAILDCVLENGCLVGTVNYGCALGCVTSNGGSIAELQDVAMPIINCASQRCSSDCGF